MDCALYTLVQQTLLANCNIATNGPLGSYQELTRERDGRSCPHEWPCGVSACCRCCASCCPTGGDGDVAGTTNGPRPAGRRQAPESNGARSDPEQPAVGCGEGRVRGGGAALSARERLCRDPARRAHAGHGRATDSRADPPTRAVAGYPHYPSHRLCLG